MNDIAIFNDVIFTFKSPFSRIFRALLAFIGNKVLI